MRRKRKHPTAEANDEPWPLERWPEVLTKYVLCTEDRFFPADLMRRLVDERLGIVSDEIVSGHCPALSRPVELAELLMGHAVEIRAG